MKPWISPIVLALVVLVAATARSTAAPTKAAWEYKYLVVETERFGYVDLDDPVEDGIRIGYQRPPTWA